MRIREGGGSMRKTVKTDNDEDMTYFANNSGMSLLDFRFG
jgi:hypothetical protein